MAGRSAAVSDSWAAVTSDEAGSVDVRVVLRDGVQIEVGDDIDPGKLCAIVVALESRC